MVHGKRCHLHHAWDKSSKGTMVVVQQHVVSLDPLPTHLQMLLEGMIKHMELNILASIT
jgi:hypothetical protein